MQYPAASIESEKPNEESTHSEPTTATTHDPFKWDFSADGQLTAHM
jgi:hypothetical protein